MKIKRTVNGTEMEFELTFIEEYNVYREYQREMDRNIIRSAFDDEDITEEDIVDTYGVGREVLESLVPEMAEKYREFLDNSNAWIYKRNAAIEYVVDAHREV